MDKAEMKEKISTFLQCVKSTREMESQLIKLFGFADGPFWEVIWDGLCSYQTLLEEVVGDKGEHISWFIYDNDMGRCGLEAGVKGNMKPIKTVDDLIWLITHEATT